MKIVIIGAYPQSIISFRGHLIKSFVDAGHTVTVMTAEASKEVVEQVESLGASFRSFIVQRNGLNPVIDLQTLYQLRKALIELAPDKVLAYTIKPIIWGGIANRMIGKASFYPMVTGLGYAFEKGSLVRNAVNTLVKTLYKWALKKAEKVIFQNEENLNTFVDLGLIEPSSARRVFGSGVDLAHFQQQPLPKGVPVFLLIARLLGDKGIREFVQAAKLVRAKYPEVRCQILGPFDSSPDRISEEEMSSWQAEKVIEYLGETTNVVPFIEQCHIYTLPSYHEGLPRTVLEAMAVGRPILTTDAVGCRDTIFDNESDNNKRNGFLVPIKNVQQLAIKMIWFVEHQQVWPDMANASRHYAGEYFDVHKVNASIADIMQVIKFED